MYETETWFTNKHDHDTANMEYDIPFFIGETLPSTNYNHLVNLDR